jgi:hypothetical protein
MAIEITYGEIKNQDFVKGLRKLVDCPDIKNVSVLLRIVKIYKAIVAAEKDCTEVHHKLLEQHGTKEETGNYKLINLDQFAADYKVLMETKLLIEEDPVKFNDVIAAKLSPSDIAALDKLVTI